MGVGRRAMGITICLLAAAAAPPASAPSVGDLRAWVEQLAAVDPADRAAAEQRLGDAGSDAIGLLTDARRDPRPEVSARATRALRRVRLFAYRDPARDAPRDAVSDATLEATGRALALAEDYLAKQTPSSRVNELAQLAAVHPVPVPVLVRLLPLEPVGSLRTQLLATAGAAYRRAVPGLIAEGDADALGPLLEQAVAELPDAGCPDVAVAAVVTGRWDETVARWQAQLANGDEPQRARAATVLCALHRVAGRFDQAAEMARRAGDSKLILATAIDRGDWPAALDAAAQVWPGAKPLPVRIGLARLAGREADVSAGLSNADAAEAGSLSVGKMRLLLGDTAGGLAKLSAPPSDGGDPVAAVHVLRVRGEYDAALALAAKFANDPDVGPAVTAVRDDLRRLLGDLPDVPPVTPEVAADVVWTRAVPDLSAGRFAEAAAALSVHDADADQLAPHYVRGFALDGAGDHARGRAMMTAASLAALADGRLRHTLARQLRVAGLDAAAGDQSRLIERSADLFSDGPAVTDAYQADQVAAWQRDDWPAAAAANDRWWLFSFWPNVEWKDNAHYVNVAYGRHLIAAQLARGRGDWTAVTAELSVARAMLPGSIETAVQWVPLFDAHGDRAAADALFATAYDATDAAAARHPRSSHLHNQAAWLAACCHRRLPDALSHARAAVRLTGNASATTLDTLAEVHFRLGDRAAALDVERRALPLSGDKVAYVARQLDRFARAPLPSATQPTTAPAD